MLSEHARAKRGDMVLEIDHRLLEAIEKAQRLRVLDEGHRLESNALPSRRENQNGDGAAGRLTPREIQARLRAGETVASLARSSGTDEAWIRRFAAPVLAEQARVVEAARSATFTKRGVGASAVALGPAVAANVIDRGVALTLPDLEAAWRAYQPPGGGWHVTFTVALRGRRQTAEWAFDPEGGELTARNKLASELGWRESAKKLPQPKPTRARPSKRPAADKPEAGKPPATKAEAPAPPAEAGPQERSESVQTLLLEEDGTAADQAETPGPSASVSPAPRPARKAPARRAAAAEAETPAGSTVPVVPAESTGSMPPTDLDVVDVIVDLRDDDTARETSPVGGPPAPSGGPPAP